MTNKKPFRTILIVSLMIGALSLNSCKKVEGPGGQASISGILTGLITGNSGSEDLAAEVTTVTCTPGAIIDDNDYWIINSPTGNLYYIWYDNSNWVGGDPALSGRIGIKVDYNFSQNNATVALNTAAAILSAASSEFSIITVNDILTITNLNFGQVADAEDMTSPMAVDVQTQGSSAAGSPTGVEGPIADERVYIVYGDDVYYGESIRTDAEGKYQFTQCLEDRDSG